MPENVILKKGGKTVVGKVMGFGKVESACDCRLCKELPRSNRYRLLPCHCHSTVNTCTCPIRDKQCGHCEKVYVQLLKDEWWEVVDPHA